MQKGKHGGARKRKVETEPAPSAKEERRMLEARIGALIDLLTEDGLPLEEFCRMSREVRFLEIRLEQLERETWLNDECFIQFKV